MTCRCRLHLKPRGSAGESPWEVLGWRTEPGATAATAAGWGHRGVSTARAAATGTSLHTHSHSQAVPVHRHPPKTHPHEHTGAHTHRHSSCPQLFRLPGVLRVLPVQPRPRLSGL